MLRHNSMKLTLSVAILVLVAIAAFVSARYVLGNGSALAGDKPGFSAASSAEEASALAGYPVQTPGYLPGNFQTPPNITVHDTSHNLPKRVSQIWNSGERETFFLLVQDPALKGISGGQQAEVHGVPGERKYTEALPDRPALLSLYWRDGDMAYVLTGTINGGLDEDTLHMIVSSVPTKN